MDEDIDSIPMFNKNINSQIAKNKKEGRNMVGQVSKKNTIEQSSVLSHEKEFPIIESYCMLVEKDNKSPNYANNDNNNNLTIHNSNESRLEAKQVQDLNERVNKILNEF